jgi:hypothetical protein
LEPDENDAAVRYLPSSPGAAEHQEALAALMGAGNNRVSAGTAMNRVGDWVARGGICVCSR